MSKTLPKKVPNRAANGGRKRAHTHFPEAREGCCSADDVLHEVARRKVREAKLLFPEPELFPRPESGPIAPGNRCLAEIADLEERFAAGELTWHDYSMRLRELAPSSQAS
jgi:hypothetical protein